MLSYLPTASKSFFCTLYDLEVQIRLFEADGDSPSRGARADPDGEPASINRRLTHIAYAAPQSGAAIDTLRQLPLNTGQKSRLSSAAQREIHMTIQVKPSRTELGAEIIGADLMQALDDATFVQVRAAFYHHEVIYFRGQALE